MESTERTKDRRYYVRYKAGSLHLWVMRASDREAYRRPDKVTAIDYSRNGVGFQTPHTYADGERLSLDLALGKERLSNVFATVRYSRTGRCGVQFDLPEGERLLEQLKALEKIERLLM